MKLGKYSMGIGDRFGHQGQAQLAAFMRARAEGMEITPVWNKSYREHEIINTVPMDTRQAADSAVSAHGWREPYFVDADHVDMKTADLFIEACDYFTIDVADYIAHSADELHIQEFTDLHKKYVGMFKIPGIDEPFDISEHMIGEIARKFLYAIEEAGRIYEHILKNKVESGFIVEISMDETDKPQSPIELFFILSAIANQGIPAQTIAPKFTGRFNKGVDYVGDIKQFKREFEQDLLVIDRAVREFFLPSNLKLSVHSGSDKFALYNPIRETLKKLNAGLHIKTAGTTWLEELIGLAEGGGDGLMLAKEIYRKAFFRFDELCKPYAAVIDIELNRLPSPDQVDQWDIGAYVSALRHDQTNNRYNRHLRQLLHVGYKIAAETGDRFVNALKRYRDSIAHNVTENIEKHIEMLFM
jgi:hypothetical protein